MSPVHFVLLQYNYYYRLVKRYILLVRIKSERHYAVKPVYRMIADYLNNQVNCNVRSQEPILVIIGNAKALDKARASVLGLLMKPFALKAFLSCGEYPSLLLTSQESRLQFLGCSSCLRTSKRTTGLAVL